MPATITWAANGKTEKVERCFWLETRGKDGTWTAQWIVQRRRGRTLQALLLPVTALTDAKRIVDA